MPNYNFDSVTDDDFERLVRDLLQKVFGFTLESFKRGRDQGTDLRYQGRDGSLLIVQCKHFVNTPLRGLISKLKKEEVPKIKLLQPQRYILATSLGLTPKNKDDILKILSPYCQSTGDIYGRDDINGLLRDFPEVETSHIKLWLTSTSVMERILHSFIFNRSEAEFERISSKLRLYVQNSSFFEARQLLSDEHYCIISGMPGIGKTTLAEALLVDHIGRGYEAYEVVNDISESFTVYDKSKQQIFYYDDFLGQTSLKEKLGKNEDRTLLNFIDLVRRSENTRLILTTREYLLNQAKATYERLEHSGFDLRRCLVELSSYTYADRANILSNHIYYSGISPEHKRALQDSDRYSEIVRHPNYNPRIIEWMTSHLNALGISSQNYVAEFIANLDEPTRLWEHAFDNQISNASQHLLLVLVSMPPQVELSQLKEAFTGFYRLSAQHYGFSCYLRDFTSALKELQGSFITSEQVDELTLIRFHNPSIRDFVESRLATTDFEIAAICRSATSFQQYVNLWNLKTHPQKGGKASAVRRRMLHSPAELINGMIRTFESEDVVRPSNSYRSGMSLYDHGRGAYPLEGRILFAFSVVDAMREQTPSSPVKVMFKSIFSILIANLLSMKGDKEALHKLLELIKTRKFELRGLKRKLLTSSKAFLMQNMSSTEEFVYFIKLAENYKGLVSSKEMKIMADNYLEFCESLGCSMASMPSIEKLRSDAENLEIIGEAFDIDMEGSLMEIYDYIDEIEEQEREDFQGSLR